MTSYIALIRKKTGSDYGVGWVAVGTSLDEARRMVAEALALHIEGMQEDRARDLTPHRAAAMTPWAWQMGHTAAIR